jgi:hypothetical protein
MHSGGEFQKREDRIICMYGVKEVKCVNTERQNLEESMRENRSLVGTVQWTADELGEGNIHRCTVCSHKVGQVWVAESDQVCPASSNKEGWNNNEMWGNWKPERWDETKDLQALIQKLELEGQLQTEIQISGRHEAVLQ